MHWLDNLKFNSDGLIPAIAQDKETGRILMMAWQNREALSLTVETGQAVYFSRSRGKLWKKGESSGHIQVVHEVRTDCDADVITLLITQMGGIACHTGRQSCFYQKLDMITGTWQAVDAVLKPSEEIYGQDVGDNHASADVEAGLGVLTKSNAIKPDNTKVLTALDEILNERKRADKDSSYVASLYHKGLNKILEKVGEEAVEAILAAKELQLACERGQDIDDKRQDLTYEVADLWFHTLVALSHLELSSDEILTELARRFGLSGIEEKNTRSQIK